jgi:hypothetical protein
VRACRRPRRRRSLTRNGRRSDRRDSAGSGDGGDEGVVGRSVEDERGAEGGDREAGSGGRHERWGDIELVGYGGVVAWWFYSGHWRPSRYPIASLAEARRLGLAHYEGEPLPPPSPSKWDSYYGFWSWGDTKPHPCTSGDEDEGGVPGVRVRSSEGGEPVGVTWSPPSSPRFVMAGCWSVQTSDGWVDRIVTVAEGHHTTVDLGSDGCGHVYPRWWCDCGRCGAGWPTGHGSTTGS